MKDLVENFKVFNTFHILVVNQLASLLDNSLLFLGVFRLRLIELFEKRNIFLTSPGLLCDLPYV